MQNEIKELTEAEKIAQAVAEGYPDVDETCPACQTVFKNFHHFIRCDQRPCPMSDGKGTLFQQMEAKFQADCFHERLNEDGICRNCGADKRGL